MENIPANQSLTKKERRELKRQQKAQQRDTVAKKSRFKKLIIGLVVIIGVVAAGGGIAAYWYQQQQPGKLDDFARCLNDKGAVFYGAFWCPHCQDQKKLFGRSAKLLPYVECSTADGRGQTADCQAKDVQGYPTWEFADGSRQSGVMTLADLAEKTTCQLPANQ